MPALPSLPPLAPVNNHGRYCCGGGGGAPPCQWGSSRDRVAWHRSHVPGECHSRPRDRAAVGARPRDMVRDARLAQCHLHPRTSNRGTRQAAGKQAAGNKRVQTPSPIKGFWESHWHSFPPAVDVCQDGRGKGQNPREPAVVANDSTGADTIVLRPVAGPTLRTHWGP